MKKLIPLVCALAMLAWGCTEIEYREIEKEVIKRDTVTKFIDRVYLGTDTVTITQVVEVPTPVRDQNDSIVYVTKTDTVYMTRIDSIFITKIVVEHDIDTVVVNQTVYGDTMVIYLFDRVAMNFPQHLQPYWSWFFEQCDARGIPYQGPGPVYLTTGKLDAVLQSMSYYVFGQFVISINDNLTVDEQYLPLLRELSRQYLGNEYSQDPNSVLNPFFPANKIRWSNKEQFEQELEELFL